MHRILVLLLALTASVHAQSARTGVLTGQVINQNTGDVLSSAFVGLAGSTVTETTDNNGMYRLVLPEGPQTIVVSYSGLDEQRFGVEVKAGGEVRRDVAMTSTLYKMDKFVVKTIREGQAAAINEQKVSPNIKNVVVLDEIGDLGTEALQGGVERHGEEPLDTTRPVDLVAGVGRGEVDHRDGCHGRHCRWQTRRS